MSTPISWFEGCLTLFVSSVSLTKSYAKRV